MKILTLHFKFTRWRRRRWLYFSTSRRWMETIQGPSCLIHKERSRKKYPRLRYPQQTRKLPLCRREGSQGNVPQDQCWEEGRDRTTCSSTTPRRVQCLSKKKKARYILPCMPRVCVCRKLTISGRGILSSAHSRNYFNEISKKTAIRENDLIGIAEPVWAITCTWTW